ncbi:MAG TPA: GNAT family N-acetyltransferase [Acidimicrobiales bacterium]
MTERLRGLGVRDIVTGALTPGEEGPFVEAGFVERDRLHLLRRDLEGRLETAATGEAEIRKPRRHDWPAVVAVDARAFQPFWHLDAGGIEDAGRATPASLTRVATLDDRVVGYAVHGRSGRRGYVQRLAVDPDASGHGVGTALLLDGLGWMAERGAVEALVNTQTSNERALSLYLRNGFVLQQEPLLVLGVRLSEP